MSAWPQVRVRYRRAYPWPCLRCANFCQAITVMNGHPEHGKVEDECSIPRHHYILLASLDEADCDDFVEKM